MGPACGTLSGSSSCARQFSHHLFTSTYLRSDLCLPPSSKLHLLRKSSTPPSLLLTPIVSPHFSLSSHPPRHRSLHSFTFVECLPSRRAFYCHHFEPPLECVATTAWLGCFLRFLRCLCFARVQFHGSLRFITFAYGKPMLEGLPRT